MQLHLRCTNLLPTLCLKKLVEQQFQVENTEEASVGAPLSLQEENVINYAAGYVCRAIRKRLERSTNPQKAELILCVMELLGDENDDDDDEDHSTTQDQEWVNLFFIFFFL